MKKLPLISRPDYNTIMLHAEKISNGQHDFAPVLRRELHDKLNIGDAESFIADLMTNKDIDFLNRQFLSRFSFIVVGEDGAHYQLVERGNFCEPDLVEQSTEPVVDDISARVIKESEEELAESMENGKAENMVVEEVTLEVRAERIRRLQADVQRGIIEIGFELIAAKKEVGHGGWADWLQKEFEWTQRTANNFMRVAERFGKMENIFQFKPSILQTMLLLPEGNEEAFIEAQTQAGSPVENQSARQVQASVKQWKKEKQKKSSPPFEEINLFPTEEELEAVIQSVDKPQKDADGEYERNPDFDSSDSELTSTPTEESNEIVDDKADELSQAQINEDNPLLETSVSILTEKNLMMN